MSHVILDLPEETIRAMQMPADAVAGELRLAAAMKLYEIGRLSSGAAAQLAGVPKPVFLSKLGAYGVAAFDLSEAELRQDARNAGGGRHHE